MLSFSFKFVVLTNYVTHSTCTKPYEWMWSYKDGPRSSRSNFAAFPSQRCQSALHCTVLASSLFKVSGVETAFLRTVAIVGQISAGLYSQANISGDSVYPPDAAFAELPRKLPRYCLGLLNRNIWKVSQINKGGVCIFFFFGFGKERDSFLCIFASNWANIFANISPWPSVPCLADGWSQ